MVLAAGASRRLGRPKQLLPFRGSTLIHHAAQTAVSAGIGPVGVVLGAHADECRTALRGLAVRIMLHEGWADGMGSTIAAAARAAQAEQATAVLLTTCDQPDVTAEDLRRLAEAHLSGGATLAAAQYGGTVGIPALFAGAALDALTRLRGERGAKPILESAGPSLIMVPCPGASRDVDTPDESARLL